MFIQPGDKRSTRFSNIVLVVKENHAIGWDEASILGREGNRSARWVRESIEIRKQDIQGHTTNRDAGTYTLSHLYDAIFSATATSCLRRKSEPEVISTKSTDVAKKSTKNTKVWFRFNYINNTICNAKFGDLGDNGRGQNMSKVPYLESLTLICLFTMQLVWGYNDKCKKPRFIHKLTASDTSKTAKITKKVILLNSTLTFRRCAGG